jgi:hypothetical protein
MSAVGINQGTNEAVVYSLGQSGTVDLRDFSHAYLIVLNTNEHSNSDNCHYTDWLVQVFDGEGEPLTQADEEIWDASKFTVAN